MYTVLGLNPVAKLSGDQIALRCVVQMLNEAVRCLEEGIISSARDGDIGAIFGIGFSPFLGGPFRYIDAMGASSLVADLRRYEAQHGSRFAPSRLLLEMAEAGKSFY